MERKKLVSIIVPAFNEQETLPEFYQKVKKVFSTIEDNWELLFVDDGSSDSTLGFLRELTQKDANVRYLSFSRNFGKEAAIYAGFCNCIGDYVAVMDADLQDPPSLLPQMLEIVKSGKYDSVATRRRNRQGEPKIRSWFSKKFYGLINRISDVDIVDGARDYRLMSRKMVDAIIQMSEQNRFSKGLYGWIGFRTYWLSYDNVERISGETKWSFFKLLKYAIGGIVDFSSAPLNLSSFSGFILTTLSFIGILVLIVRRFAFGDPVAGWASTIVTLLFIGGILLLNLGIMGQYLARTYTEVKGRPHYIIAESSDEE